MQDPDAAAIELVRSVKELGFVGAMVNGTTEGRFLDHPSYDSLLAAAVEVDVPVYIHPHLAPEAVRKAYFSDLEPGADRVRRSVPGYVSGMSHERALLLSLGSFVLFGAGVVLLFVVLDIRLLLAIGPLVAIGIASVGVYRSAVGGSA